MAELGINVTMVEPDGFGTDFGGPSSAHAEQIDAYEPVRAANAERWSSPESVGDAQATGPAILDADEPPLRMFFGANSPEAQNGGLASTTDVSTWRSGMSQ